MPDRLRNFFTKHEALVLGFGSLLWFTILTPWGVFPDPDAFYHAHLAERMLDHGAVTSFHWLDLTTLGSHFADQHYFFHLILGPAIAAFGAFWGTQLMAPLLATLAVLGLWTVLRGLGVRHAWVWVVLALLVPGWSFRLLLAKASPLAIGAYVVTLGAVATRRPRLAFFAGVLFALSHGGWIVALFAIGLMLMADALTRRLVDGISWLRATTLTSWHAGLGLLLGIVVGLLIHPGRAELFRFLWVQVVKVVVRSPRGSVIAGLEWLPAQPLGVLADVAPLAIALVIGFWAVAMTLRRNSSHSPDSDHHSFRLAILFALPVALTFALTLLSQRMIEYLVPSLALWCACVWQLVDVTELRRVLRELQESWPKSIRPYALAVLISLAIILAGHHAYSTWSALRRPAARPFNAYRTTFSAISERATPGDRVFHSDWDEFPVLFAADDRLRYISGLDPTFLYEASSTLSDAVRDLTIGWSTTTAWEVIVERTQSRFVFVTTKRHPTFDTTLKADPRFHEIARDEETAAYEVKPQ